MKSKALLIFSALSVVTIVLLFFGCPSGKKSVVEGDAAQKVYVAPGQYDEFYTFMSGDSVAKLVSMGSPVDVVFA